MMMSLLGAREFGIPMKMQFHADHRHVPFIHIFGENKRSVGRFISMKNILESLNTRYHPVVCTFSPFNENASSRHFHWEANYIRRKRRRAVSKIRMIGIERWS